MRAFSFPYPVLGNADDIEGQFDPKLREVVFSSDGECRLHACDLTIDNKTLAALVADGSARYVLRVDCANTYLRQSFTTDSPVASFSLPASKLKERVDVSFRVCATQPIALYTPDGLHPDYGSASFEVEAGDVLAIGPKSTFFAQTEFDPLKAPVASLLMIRKGQHESGPFHVQYETGGGKIEIELSHADWILYHSIKAHTPLVLTPAIALPVVAEALGKLNDDDLEGMLWVDRLKTLLELKNLTDHSDGELVRAQHLLEGPLNRGFSALSGYFLGDDDE